MNEIRIDFTPKDLEIVDNAIKDNSLKSSLWGILNDKSWDEVFFSYDDIIYACHKFPSIYKAVDKFFTIEAAKDPRYREKSHELMNRIEKDVWQLDHPENKRSKMN